MADMLASHVVDRFKAYIKTPMNSGLSWGSGVYPKHGGYSEVLNRYKTMFTGAKSGQTSTPNANNYKNKDADISDMVSDILTHAKYYTNIRKVKIYVRYRYNNEVSRGSYTGRNSNRFTITGPNRYRTIENATKIGHLNNGWRRTLSTPTSTLKSGNNAVLGDITDYIQAVRADAIEHKNDTVEYSKTLCHSSCHNSCHSSCHGDGPGGGSNGGHDA